MFGHTPEDAAKVEVEPEVLVLLVALVGALHPNYIIETGTYQGTTAKAIGEVLAAQGNGEMDTMEICEQCVDTARLKVAGLPVTVHHDSSLNFVPKKPIDFAFLDSNVGDVRFQELKRFAPHMAPQGIVAIHDAKGLWPAKPSFKGWRWVRLTTPLGLALFQRIE
jgi:predicted O-methyltransferase YrrM